MLGWLLVAIGSLIAGPQVFAWQPNQLAFMAGLAIAFFGLLAVYDKKEGHE